MRFIQIILILAAIVLIPARAARAQRGGSGRGSGGSVSVRGYTRSDGTSVAPSHRSAPDGREDNNWSTKGNVNPYTGKIGTENAASSGGFPAGVDYDNYSSESEYITIRSDADERLKLADELRLYCIDIDWHKYSWGQLNSMVRQVRPQKKVAATCHNELGTNLYINKQWIKAETEFRQAIVFAPDNALYHANAGATLFNQNKLCRAAAELREAVQLNPNETVYRKNFGRILFTASPLTAKDYNQDGVALFGQRKLAEAEASFREAVCLESNNALYIYNLGTVLNAEQRYGEAEAAITEAIRLAPNERIYRQNLEVVRANRR